MWAVGQASADLSAKAQTVVGVAQPNTTFRVNGISPASTAAPCQQRKYHGRRQAYTRAIRAASAIRPAHPIHRAILHASQATTTTAAASPAAF